MPKQKSTARDLERLLPAVIQSLFGGAEDPLESIPIGQLRMIRHLESGPKTPTQLANMLGLTMGAISQLAQRLRSAEILEEQIDEHDRRSKTFALSARGQELMERRAAARVLKADAILSAVPVDVQQSLITGLEAVLRCSNVESIDRSTK